MTMNQETIDKDVLDFPGNKPALPTGLNVLTILSIIGCALQLIGICWSYFSSAKTYEQKDKVLEQMNSGQLPSWAKSMMGDPEHFEMMVTKSYQNRVPIFIIGLVAISLCFYGVIQMRKLKKQGFLFYTIGELLPFVSMAVFVGMFTFSGFSFIAGAVIALLFILLYSLQRKSLVY